MTPAQGALLSAQLVRLITVRPPSLESGPFYCAVERLRALDDMQPESGIGRSGAQFWGSYQFLYVGRVRTGGYLTFMPRSPVTSRHNYACPRNKGVGL